MRATPKLSFCGIDMLALNPCSLTPSHREPTRGPVMAVPLQLGSFGSGMVFHICCTTGLIPNPVGSQGLFLPDPQLVPVAMLKSVGTGGFATGSAWHSALQTLKCSMPLRMFAVGTSLSMVATLFQRKPW